MIKKPEDFDREWHLDKRVPIAFICTILLQTFAIGWWTSRIDSRVTVLESGNPSGQLTSIAVDIAALKEKAQTTKDDISGIRRSMEMLMQQVLQDTKRR